MLEYPSGLILAFTGRTYLVIYHGIGHTSHPDTGLPHPYGELEILFAKEEPVGKRRKAVIDDLRSEIEGASCHEPNPEGFLAQNLVLMCTGIPVTAESEPEHASAVPNTLLVVIVVYSGCQHLIAAVGFAEIFQADQEIRSDLGIVVEQQITVGT